MIRFFLFSFFILYFYNCSFSQGTRINNDSYFIYDTSISHDSGFHFTIKPYFNKYNLTIKSEFGNLEENTLIGSLLNTNLISDKNEQRFYSINPILSSYVGISDKGDFEQDYKIGASFNGGIKENFFFHTDLYYSKRSYFSEHSFLIDSFSILPFYGNFLNNSGNYYSFINFTGELLYVTNEGIRFHLGNGKSFFGNGYRSLFLSDNSHSYPYFKTSFDIGKLKYVWMIAFLRDVELFYDIQSFKLYNKAAFIHYLSLNLTKRINLNFFDAILTNPFDSKGKDLGYEISYFNPIIFYRPIEFYNGSDDNALFGIGLNFRFFKSTYIYSQFILDDILISSLKEKSGWWGNKIGIQFGIKSYNLFKISGLFFRAEFNAVMPYTYSHNKPYFSNEISNLNYGHYRQSLSHPLGANFIETVFNLRYLRGRFLYSAKIFNSQIGEDIEIESLGSDIYKSYNLRPSDYNVKLLQGKLSNMKRIELSAAYIINPSYDLMFEAKFGYYNRTIDNINSSHINFHLGIITKIFNESTEYLNPD